MVRACARNAPVVHHYWPANDGQEVGYCRLVWHWDRQTTGANGRTQRRIVVHHVHKGSKADQPSMTKTF